MRINRLTLKNLNSLRGEFRLDFTQPPLAEAGIFAITGPTGAGKTTILDAICVALYGQTPRLGPGSSAELLTRNCGDCFAEVEFTVEQGSYRSRWSRRRAHGRADGNLQPTAMELVALGDDGEAILEDQVRQVIERVEALTGLDFARFTRSVLLAQGSFASFLKAKDNERAELLERMTGTRIYSFISVAAFNRARDEKERLEQLIAVNDHLDLLPAEALAELQTEIATLAEAIALAEAELVAWRGQEALANRYATLGATLHEAEQERLAMNAEAEAAAEDLGRLARAERAWPLRPELQALDTLHERLAGLQAEATTLGRDREGIATRQQKANDERLALAEEGERFAAAAAKREVAIGKAERLDQELRLHHDSLASRQRTMTTIAAEVARLLATCRGQEEALAGDVARIEALAATLEKTAVDAALGQDLSLIVEALGALTHQRQRYAVNQGEQRRLAQLLANLAAAEEQGRDRQARARREVESIREELRVQQETLAASLQGQGREAVEQGLAAQRQRLVACDRVVDLQTEARRLERERATLVARRTAVLAEAAEVRARSQEVSAAKTRAEELLALLEERQILAARLAHYESDRRQLAAGRPCPLCGSLNHPWQEGAPAVDQDRQAVVAQRQVLSALTGDKGTLDGRLQELEAVAQALATDSAALGQAGEGVGVELARAVVKAGLVTAAEVDEARALLVEQIAADEGRITRIAEAGARGEALLRRQVIAERELATAAGELVKTQALAVEQQASLSRYQEEERALLARGVELKAAASRGLSPYGIEVPGANQEEACCQELRRRWQAFAEASRQRVELESGVGERRQAVAGLRNRIEAEQATLAREKEALGLVTATIEALGQERLAILGTTTVAAARQQLAEERDELHRRLGECERVVNDLLTQAATLDELLQRNGRQVERLTAEAAAAAETLDQAGQALGFADRAALRQAMLPEAELRALGERREALALRRQRIEDRVAETRAQLAELGEAAAGLDRQAVSAAVIQAGAALAEQQQSLGARREQLRRQQVLAEEHRQGLERIEAQRREYRRWQQLSDLIGSADGKKFRRFAQGLTLDHLIILANRQLARLSDRYLLRRHQGEELGLEIMDTYQADAIRPIGTLSGGEEFLVSLALALGLANLSGQTRIDSLFLDEGFGTLDTDTLETALAALAALYETGKTIGVISHVDALKERIPVQIRLQKQAGGVSTLSISA